MIKNEAQVNEYFKLFNTLDSNGNAWVPSEQGLFQRSLFKDIQRLNGLSVTQDEAYIVLDSMTVYPDLNGRGDYFTRGSIVSFGELFESEYGKFVNVRISGSTFRVTSDASFGNTPSTWMFSAMKTKGITKEVMVVKVQDAIDALNVWIKNKEAKALAKAAV